MSLSSFRLMLLRRVARLLQGWLHTVSAQIEPPPSQPFAPPPVQRPVHEPSDPRRPAPPAHWVELVQQYAPHLLDPVAADPSDERASWNATDPVGDAPEREVFEYRAHHVRVAAPQAAAPKQPVRAVPLHRAPDVAPTTKSVSRRPLSNRPMRLDQVSARSLDAEEIAAHAMHSDGDQIELPIVNTTAQSFAEDAEHIKQSGRSSEGGIEHIEQRVRTVDPQSFAPAEGIAPPVVRTSLPVVEAARQGKMTSLLASFSRANRSPQPEVETLGVPARHQVDLPSQSVREISAQPDSVSVRSPEMPPSAFERQHIRETTTSLPNSVDVPMIRTGTGQVPSLHQQRTTVPSAPAQTVFRPTLPAAPLNLEDVTPGRWPSLPDEPTEAPRDPVLDQQRRERLKREQEGRAWSE